MNNLNPVTAIFLMVTAGIGGIILSNAIQNNNNINIKIKDKLDIDLSQKQDKSIETKE